MTSVGPSPFLTSPAPTSQAVESAVAPNTPPCAAAGLIHSSCGGVEGHARHVRTTGQWLQDGGVQPNNLQPGTGAGIKPGPQDQFPPGFDPEKFIEACLKPEDPMPLFLAAPRKEYLAIMGQT